MRGLARIAGFDEAIFGHVSRATLKDHGRMGAMVFGSACLFALCFGLLFHLGISRFSITAFAAVFGGLLWLNLQRLVLSGARFPLTQDSAEIASWKPAWGGIVITLLVGMIVIQPLLAGLAGPGNNTEVGHALEPRLDAEGSVNVGEEENPARKNAASTTDERLTEKLLSLIQLQTGKQFARGVEVLLESKVALPSWVALDELASELEQALPGHSKVHRQTAPWFEGADKEKAQMLALSQAGALVHVQFNSRENELVYMVSWMETQSVVTDSDGSFQTFGPDDGNRLPEGLLTLVKEQTGKQFARGVEVLLESRGALPSWVVVDELASELGQMLPGESKLHRQTVPWFDGTDTEREKKLALSDVGALVHVQLNPKKDELDVFLITSTKTKSVVTESDETVHSFAPADNRAASEKPLGTPEETEKAPTARPAVASHTLVGRIRRVWAHAYLAIPATLIGGLLLASSLISRQFLFLEATREYERVHHARERDQVEQTWLRYEQAIDETLRRQGHTRRYMGSNPLNCTPLVAGRESGVVVADGTERVASLLS